MTRDAEVKQSRFAPIWLTKKLSRGLRTVHGIGGLVKATWENALGKVTTAITSLSRCANMYLRLAMEIVGGLLKSLAQDHQVNASATTMFAQAAPRIGASFILRNNETADGTVRKSCSLHLDTVLAAIHGAQAYPSQCANISRSTMVPIAFGMAQLPKLRHCKSILGTPGVCVDEE